MKCFPHQAHCQSTARDVSAVDVWYLHRQCRPTCHALNDAIKKASLFYRQFLPDSTEHLSNDVKNKDGLCLKFLVASSHNLEGT